MMPFFKLTLRILCLGLCLTTCVTVAEENESEYKIKAGYLYNFIKFVTWPMINTPVFNVCIIGSDPFGALIDPIENRSAFGIPIRLIRIKTPVVLPYCHIIFLGTGNPKNVLDKLLTDLPTAGQTLLVGEDESFAERGGMVGMVETDGRVKLNINIKAVQQSGLIMSGKLLEIADLVGDDTHD